MPKKVVFNKLVRDKIPQYIKSCGNDCDCKVVGVKEYKELLKKKVIEESEELIKAKTKKDITEEIADVYEIVDALARSHGIRKNTIDALRREKNKKKGAFKKRIKLISSTYKNG